MNSANQIDTACPITNPHLKKHRYKMQKYDIWCMKKHDIYIRLTWFRTPHINIENVGTACSDDFPRRVQGDAGELHGFGCGEHAVVPVPGNNTPVTMRGLRSLLCQGHRGGSSLELGFEITQLSFSQKKKLLFLHTRTSLSCHWTLARSAAYCRKGFDLPLLINSSLN